MDLEREAALTAMSMAIMDVLREGAPVMGYDETLLRQRVRHILAGELQNWHQVPWTEGRTTDEQHREV